VSRLRILVGASLWMLALSGCDDGVCVYRYPKPPHLCYREKSKLQCSEAREGIQSEWHSRDAGDKDGNATCKRLVGRPASD
jgi:hypothetical protein